MRENGCFMSNLQMPLRLVSLFAALGLCAGAPAADPSMTKVVVRMIVPSETGEPIPAKPKTMYLAGEKYARVEEELDAAAGSQKLIITNEPDSWVINLVNKTAQHLVDSGPKFVTHAPIFWTSSGQPEPEFEELEFGAEMTFFGEGRGRPLKPRNVDGRRYKALSIKTGEHEAVLLIDPKTGKPFQINLIKFGRLVSSVRYLSYKTKLPFDASLFQPPPDIQITQEN
jgi:hypothetical protein